MTATSPPAPAPASAEVRARARIIGLRRGALLDLQPGARARNLVDLAWRSVEAHATRDAVRWKAGGTWHSRSYAELGDWVARLSLGLAAAGISRGDRVVLMSGSRPEWLAADLACLALGAVTCPIYPGDGDENVGRILAAVDPQAAIVEGAREAERVVRLRAGRPHIALIVAIEPVAGIRSLDDVAIPEETQVAQIERWREGWQRIGRDDLATIVHTSGTTGTPKGVLLTHGNLLHNAETAPAAIPFTPDDIVLTMLPLSHMFARSAGMFAPLGLGITIAFAEPVLTRLASNLVEVRPTVMLTIPLFFQRIYKRITDEVAAGPAWKRRIFRWAAGLGPQRYENHLAGRQDGLALRVQLWLASRLVFDRIKARTGGRLRFFASGGAPLPREIGELFYAMDMLILEGYGLTETSPFLCLNTPETFKFGTVGYPFPETEIALDEDSGEIVARGPQVMRGYLDDPGATAAVIDPDGWFHTGDVGMFDEAGRLLITDRIKNLIVLSTGKKVTPGPMQAALAASPYIAQTVFLGDGHEWVGALIAPNVEHLHEWAAEHNLPTDDDSALFAGPEVRRLLEGEVRRLLTGFAAWERPRRIAALPRELSEERGELTSMGKPRRPVIEANWPDEIASLFGGEPTR
jgi:long-chain acyl-CoA synthetase